MLDSNLISDQYKKLNETLHSSDDLYGRGGWKRGEQIFQEFISNFGLRSGKVLDYGCGKGTLERLIRKTYAGFQIVNYDPCIPAFSERPVVGFFDGVVCSDVLEHIEPNLLDNVLKDVLSFGDLFFFNIALCPSNKKLPDGRNAHLTIEGEKFWKDKLSAFGFEQILELENEKSSTNPKLVFLTGVWKRNEQVNNKAKEAASLEPKD